jgi:Sec7-like guanine-nucleotide exchange factor
VFIEEVFLKILNSGNSSYQHKFLILQVLNKIAINPKIIVELFLNYDCDKDAKSILKSIIDSMAKISQGKFLKSEHTALIQPNEEASLKLISLDTLSIITKGLYEFQEGKQLSDSRMSAKNDKSMIDQSQISDDSDTKLEPKGFEKALIEKNQLASAAIKFNIKPKAALAYLTQNGFIAESPIEKRIQDTLIFISKTPELDKGKIGELFGDKDEFNKRLMYAYIDSLNMKGLTLVSSIRLLFSCFRPVGESQIMDRILVKYGEKYTKDNPDKFTNAGIPYEMSYAIMILQTNNHNPQVKKKMTFV